MKKIIKFHFYKGKSLLSWAIKFRTLSIYSHVAIEIDGIVYESWQGKKNNGVVKSNNPLTYHKKGTKIETILVPMEKWLVWKEFLELQVGKKYDYKAIFNFAFNWKKQNPDRWFCSELASTFFQFECNKQISDRLVSPQGMYDLITGYVEGLLIVDKKK